MKKLGFKRVIEKVYVDGELMESRNLLKNVYQKQDGTHVSFRVSGYREVVPLENGEFEMRIDMKTINADVFPWRKYG